MSSPTSPPPGAPPPLDQRERAELERLRAEATRWHGRRGRAGRRAASVLLLVLAAGLAIASLTTIFVREEVLDTQRYVATVAPLAGEPSVQDALADRLTDEIVTRLDLTTRIQQLADEAEELGAPELLDALVGPAVSGIQSFLRTELRAVLASEEFAQLWEQANRVAHDELVALLTTGEGEFLSADGEQISIDLGAVVATVRQRLIDGGFPLAEEIPADLSLTYPLFTSDALPELRTAAYLLQQASWLLPLLTLLLLIAGVLTHPDRRAGLLVAGVAVALAALVMLAALALAREYYLDHLPSEVGSRAAAQDVFDTVLRFYVDALRTLTVLAVIVALASWLAGPGRPARAIRRGVGRGLDLAARGLRRAGLRGLVPDFVNAHRRVIEAAVVVAAVAALVIWRQPGIAGTLWLTAGVLVVLAVAELLARAAGTPAGARTAGPVAH